MAVVQISKIQHRRGKENEGTGLPQLASAEIGWAIDTQKLYIGNGAVSEGAPYVGNTQILTEHSDLFALSEGYEYKSGNVTDTAARSLQSKLDENVSVLDFGAKGDGVNDDTASIQSAIDQIYLNTTDPQEIVEISIPAGVYIISDRLEIPPKCRLIGEGIGKTIIRQTGASFILRTVNADSTPGNYLTVQGTVGDVTDQLAPKDILIEDITFETTNSNYQAFMLNFCKDSVFDNIEIIGTWTTGNTGILADTNGDPETNLQCAVEFVAFSNSVTCSNITFSDVRVSNFALGAKSKYDIENIRFRDSSFKELGYAMLWGQGTIGNLSGERRGPTNVIVENSVFENIAREAIYQENGFGLLSYSNRFTKVGNMGGGESSNVTSVLNLKSGGGISNNDYFDRRKTLSDLSNILTLQTKIQAVAGNSNATIIVNKSPNDAEEFIGRQFQNGSTIYTIVSYTPGTTATGDTVVVTPALTATINSGIILSTSYNFSDYIPEVVGPTKVEHCHAVKANLETASDRPLLKLPGNITGTYEIDYTYTSSVHNATFTGTITATLNADVSPITAECSFDYSFSGAVADREKLSFGAAVGDYNNASVADALEINYTNILDNDTGIMYYTIRSFIKS